MLLRKYQIDAITEFFYSLRRYKRQHIVLPTGAGKTYIAGHIARRYLLEYQKPVLFLAHRQELLEQTIDEFNGLGLKCSLIQGKHHDERGDVVVASTATLARGRKLEKEYGLVIYDECHHALADGNLAMLSRLPFDHLLGITATPVRMDGRDIRSVFGPCTYRKGLLELIEEGYLSSFETLERELNISFRGIRKSRGDYSSRDISKIFENSDEFFPGLLVSLHIAVMERDRKKILVFLPSVALAKRAAEILKEFNVPSAYISGDMDVNERKRILKAFEGGDIHVLFNCMLLTEGYNCPSIDCIVVARPTLSEALYRQMIGRGLRKHNDKDYCLIVDVVPREGAVVTSKALFEKEAALQAASS